MAKLLIIRMYQRPSMNAKPSGLFKAVEAEILREYCVFESRSATETLYLLEKHQFQAILIITLGAKSNHELLDDRLYQFIQTGGTLILTSCCFDALSVGSACSFLNTDFALRGYRLNNRAGHYHLNQNFQNIFGPSVFASLDDKICTTLQTVTDIPDSAKIYKSARGSVLHCAAAFIKRGKGYIGFLGDTEDGPAAQTLLVAMLDHAIKPYTPPPAAKSTSILPIPPFNKAASHGPPRRMPRLMDANSGCTVCQILVPAKKCGNCRLVQYCSTNCQTADWKSHQAMCIAAKKDEASSVTGQWTPATTSDAQDSSASDEMFDEWD